MRAHAPWLETCGLVLLLSIGGLARAAWAEEEPGAPSGPDASGGAIVLDQEWVEIPALLEAVDRERGLSLHWDPRERQISDQRLRGPIRLEGDAEAVLGALRALLVPYDLVVTPLGEEASGRWWVTNLRTSSLLKLRPRPVELNEATAKDLERQHGLYVTATLPVRHLDDVTELSKTLHRFVTGQNIGRVFAAPEAGAIVVQDFAPSVVSAWRILRALDVPAPAGRPGHAIQVLPLAHADAETVAAILIPLFGANPPQPWERPAHPAVPATTDPRAPRIHADARLDQLVVRATPDDLARIREVIGALDRPSAAPRAPETVLAVIHLDHAEAPPVASALMRLLSLAKGAWAAEGGAPSVVAHDARTLLVQATPPALEKIRRVIAEIDTPEPTAAPDDDAEGR